MSALWFQVFIFLSEDQKLLALPVCRHSALDMANDLTFITVAYAIISMAMYLNMQPVHSDSASNTVVMVDPESVVAKIKNVLPITVFVHYITPLYSYIYCYAFK